MRMKSYSVAAICLAFLGAAGGGVWWWATVKPVSDVQRRVLESLNDPDSARFRDVKFFSKTGAGCGEVNAKNKMGGYTGFTSFIAFKDGEVRFSPPDEAPTTDMERLKEYIQKLENFVTLINANCPEEKKKAA